MYRVTVNPGNRVMALKWYTNEFILRNKAFRRNLEDLCRRPSPSPAFLWPEAVTARVGHRYGYIMPLSDELPDLGQYFCPDVFPDAYFRSWEARINAALAICSALSKLHLAGMSYQDINDGSFLIHPVTGHVRICDNDNIVPHGVSTGMQGKVRYSAAEVIAGRAPDQASDCMSLAIVLYRIFAVDHPFEGRNTLGRNLASMSAEDEAHLFGSDAVFCHDSRDDSNRPDRRHQPNSLFFWPHFTDTLRAAFAEALSRDAITLPKRRYTASMWQRILRRERAALITCHGGGDSHDFLSADTLPPRCPYCGVALHGELWLRFFSGGAYRLTDGKALYLQFDSEPAGRCRRIGGNRSTDVFVLSNISSDTWTVTSPGGGRSSVPPGGQCRLMPDDTIDFGRVRARVSQSE